MSTVASVTFVFEAGPVKVKLRSMVSEERTLQREADRDHELNIVQQKPTMTSKFRKAFF